MTRTMMILGILLIMTIAVTGCGGGGGGSTGSSSNALSGSTGSSGNSQQQANTASISESVTQSVQQIQILQQALVSSTGVLTSALYPGQGNSALKGSPALGDTTITSWGNTIIEVTTPNPSDSSPTGSVIVTIYDASLAAGVNFIDSDGNGKVSSIDEKITVTAKKTTESRSNFTFDFASHQMSGVERARQFASDGAAVKAFARGAFTSALTFSGETGPDKTPTFAECNGEGAQWVGSAAQTASDVDAQDGLPDKGTAEYQGKFHGIYDIQNQSSVNDHAGVEKVGSKYRLSIGHMTGTMSFSSMGGTCTSTQNGTIIAYERSDAYNLDTEVTLGSNGYSFTPTDADTLVTDATVICKITASHGGVTVKGTVVDNARGITFDFTAQNGSLTGQIIETATGTVIATIVVDKDGNGTITFADGTTLVISSWDVVI